MSKSEKAKLISKLVFSIIWLVLALIAWIGGLVVFIIVGFGESAEPLAPVAGWFGWGMLCAIVIIGTVVKNAFKSGKQGAIDGSNEYSASISGNTVTVQNHPFRGAIIGFFGGLLGGVLFGPVLLIKHIIRKIKLIIKISKKLKELKQNI